MKNVTITLAEDVAQWARVRAAQLNTSVSRMLGDMLRDLMDRDRNYQSTLKEYLSREPQVLSGSGEAYPQREGLHARSSIR
jgi:hypothetical protein